MCGKWLTTHWKRVSEARVTSIAPGQSAHLHRLTRIYTVDFQPNTLASYIFNYNYNCITKVIRHNIYYTHNTTYIYIYIQNCRSGKERQIQWRINRGPVGPVRRNFLRGSIWVLHFQTFSSSTWFKELFRLDGMWFNIHIFLNIIHVRPKLQNILPKPAVEFSFDPHVLNVWTCELLHSGERYSANKVLLFSNWQFHNIYYFWYDLSTS